ncbi:MAG: hypothetical protein R2932_32140 [Caldilineaceae bacterium]
MAKTSTSFYLSDETKATIRVVARHLRLSQAALIEFAVRQVAWREGLSAEDIQDAIELERSAE